MAGGGNSNGREQEWSVLSPEDIASLLGVTTDEFLKFCGDIYPQMDLRYKPVEGQERDRVILEVIKRLESGFFTVSGEERLPNWENGWGENLERFKEELNDKALIPAYVRPNSILRINGQYARSSDSYLELSFYTLLRTTLFKKYFQSADSIYEFGCGTGYNLVMLARMYPEKELYGLDWASTSVELVNKIASFYKYNLTGLSFDMFNPLLEQPMSSNTVLLTLNSMEQLSKKWNNFLDFIMLKKPSLCVHAEPFAELYNEDSLIDYMALKYHRARGYLDGYLTRLRELEDEGLIEILKTHRISFGSHYHEGYSLVVWRPK